MTGDTIYIHEQIGTVLLHLQVCEIWTDQRYLLGLIGGIESMAFFSVHNLFSSCVQGATLDSESKITQFPMVSAV